MQATSPSGNSSSPLPDQSSPIKPVVWGAVLIVCGVLFLFQSLGFFPNASVWLISLLFGVVGAMFLALYLLEREKSWWAAIPGMTLVGLALMVYLGANGGAPGAVWAAPVFLACIAFGFLLAQLARNGAWWAVIPFGVLLSVAAMVGLTSSGFVSGEQGVSVLFFGMGLTFLAVPFLPGTRERRWWGFIPALVLMGMGVLFFSQNLEMLTWSGWMGPVAIIAAGVWIVYRSITKPHAQ